MAEGINQKESLASPNKEPALSPAQQMALDEQLDQWMPQPSIKGTSQHYESSLDVEQQSQRRPEAIMEYYPATMNVTSSKRKWKPWQIVTAAILVGMFLFSLIGFLLFS